MQDLNLWAVLVAGVGSQVLGFFWFDRKRGLFGSLWGKYFYGLSRLTMLLKGRPPKAVIARAFAFYIAVNILAAFVFLLGMDFYLRARPLMGGGEVARGAALAYGLFVWAGFTLPHSIAKVVWQFKSWKVVWIESGYEILRFQLWALLFWYWR